MVRAGRGGLLLSLTAVLAGCGGTGPLEELCLASGRAAANPALCACVQSVADRDLTRADQRLAQRFFSDPHLAQEVRQSDSPAREAFWDRYTAFGEEVERRCRRYR